jgi:putative endonuclease
MNDYYVYIISNSAKVIYIGVTNDLKRRLFEHRSNMIPGFSKTNNCRRLVYWQYFKDVRCAIAREKQLKGWRREKKVGLIELENKNWKDLTSDLLHPSVCQNIRHSQDDK